MKYLIIGGTGSWGQELTKQLLEKIHGREEIIIFSRNEFNQVEMQRKFNDPRIKFVIGDVRDLEALYKVTKGIDIAFHLAALKHIPICEEQPYEAFKTNVEGTKNVIQACNTNKVGKLLFCSTDKAANPINFYGVTKSMSEKFILDSDYSCVRGGNVIGSRGSVIPYFIEMIKNNRVYVTNPEMTRFFMTIPHAIELLLTALKSDIKGIFIMKMKSTTLIDLIQVLMDRYGDSEIEIIGERKGEKTHEILVTPEEAKRLFHYNEDFFVYSKENLNLEKAFIESYSSKDNQMTKEELKLLLTEAGYL